MGKLERYLIYTKRIGIKKALIKFSNKILKRARYPLIDNYEDLRSYFNNKKGLEIGGPSYFFDRQGFIPIYKEMESLDGINFSSSTVWTGDIKKGGGFFINGKRVGKQYIMDATKIVGIKRESYDFVLSCNNIEHIANPLKAVEGWIKLIKKGGVLVIVAPRKESNFDHNRPTVKFEHLLEDYQRDIQEDDLTHLSEILELHDFELDPVGGTKEQFKERAIKNFENRCLHHHVFNKQVLESLLKNFNLEILREDQLDTDFVIIGRK